MQNQISPLECDATALHQKHPSWFVLAGWGARSFECVLRESIFVLESSQHIVVGRVYVRVIRVNQFLKFLLM